MQLIQVVLIVVVWAWTSVYFAHGLCECPEVQSNRGFHTNTPCNECPTGRYRSCNRGSVVAYHNTTCMFASKEKYTHAAARMMCSDSDGGGFLAFATSPEENKHVSGTTTHPGNLDYVRDKLKQSVEANGTYFWLGGKHKYAERTNQTFWLFEYRGYYENVPVDLLPEDIDQAIAERERLPAVCYVYRNVAKHFCRQDYDKDWTLFQGKCYYAYSGRGNATTYKTYFDAQAECKNMGAVLATVTDKATFKKTLDLATGLQAIVGLNDASWIGLQFSAKGNGGIYYNITDDTSRNFTEGHVEGWWEDGTPYDANPLKSFWADGQPDEEPLTTSKYPEQIGYSCNHATWSKTLPEDYNRDRCNADQFQHCALVFPSGSIANCPRCIPYKVGKWSDDWCYYRRRGYICQRDAKPNPAYYPAEGRCVPSDPSSALLRF